MQNPIRPIEDYFSSMQPPTLDTEMEYAWFSGLKLAVYNSICRFRHADKIEERVN